MARNPYSEASASHPLPHSDSTVKRLIRTISAALKPAIGTALAVALTGYLTILSGIPLLMAPLGATCVLLFAMPASPLSQPRNVIGGHCLSTATGILALKCLGPYWWTAAIAAGLAVFLMLLTRTLHPPAGADPVLIIAGGSGVTWNFLITPVLAGSVVLVLTAVVYHKFHAVSYPRSAKE
ncbi:HPP family protein [Paenibacillus lutrae]|uniref:HPP family protein n=1 Tax=Paenibacillus lutrae TaxID=2078573 RepID=A0A7X3FLT7_9BACL|nr:HPP family protein [Paenibacillus lutrae]MVP01992.1 HPP family protein [Paenibacillus lutrae]